VSSGQSCSARGDHDSRNLEAFKPGLLEETANDMTRYASLTRKQAALILLCLCASIACTLRMAPKRTLIPTSYDPKKVDTSDMAVYQKTVQRVHNGENYYNALGGVLRSARRPTRSVFNWRTPLHLTMVALLPDLAWSRVILAVLGLFALLPAFAIMTQEGFAALAAVEALLMLGPLLVCFTPEGVFFAEVWAGASIAASVGAYAMGSRKLGIALALLAVFFRELALPYVLVCGLLAWKEKRRSEVLSLGIGLLGYLGYFAAHVMKVNSLLTSADLPILAGWVQFGGIAFLLRASCVGWLMILPPWVTAVYLPVSVLGLAGWKHAIARRVGLTVGAYLASFSVVGHFVNLYWGALYTPLLSFGAVLGGVSLYELIQASGLWRGKAAAKAEAPVAMEASV
jgi:hypothetical protein